MKPVYLCFGFVVGKLRIYDNTAAILADNNLFVHSYFELLLRRDAVKAASACVTLYGDYSKTVAGIFAYALECLERALVNRWLECESLFGKTLL